MGDIIFMDLLNQLGSSAEDMSYKAMTNFKEISKTTKTHLTKVYTTLAMMVFISALGCYAHVAYGVGGPWSGLITIGFLMWLQFTDKREEQKRLGILAGFCVFEGLSIGPLVNQSLYLDPSIVVTAFLGAAAIFACFTAASLFSKQRSLLYLGGVLGSALMVMCMLTLINAFFLGSTMLYYAELYVGLLIFSAYVAFDTQLIIARYQEGDRDYIMHAQTLFVDFVQLFIRILAILNDKENDKRRKRDE